MSTMLQGMHPNLAQIVNRIIEESGGAVTVSSGFRTRDQQQRLYDLYRQGRGNLAARPGTSRHEHGLAVDFGGDLDLAAQLAQRYGLQATVPGEPWHFELGGDQAQQVGDDWYQQQGLQFDLMEDTRNPEDIIANRLNMITSIIGSDPLTELPGVQDDPALVKAPKFDIEQMDGMFPPGMEPGADPGAAAGMLGALVGQGGAQGVGAAVGGMADPNGYGAIAKQLMSKFGWGGNDYAALVELWNRESGTPGAREVTWNPSAANPNSSARGIAQKMTSIHGPIERTAAGQIKWGLNYIYNRYGSPSAALRFHNQRNWY